MTAILRAPVGSGACAHCGKPRPAGSDTAFCCRGCEAVSRALCALDLDRYYALRGADGEPIGEQLDCAIDATLIDELEARIAEQTGPQRVALSLQGARCAACVWVLEQLFSRLPGALRIDVNVARGSLELLVTREFPIRRYVESIASVGYRVGRRGERAADASDSLLVRLGVCVALAMNAMAFSAAIHLGIEAGPLRDVLHDLSFAASMLAALIGGPVFFGSALRSLRAGVLHLDLPIAVGIALTTVAALWSYFGGHAEAAYFDSLAAFVALMIAGRYVQERAVARSRAELLDDPGAFSLRCRVERDRRLELSPCSAIEPGDVLLIPPGELVPVASTLLSDSASCSLAWIDGESEPRGFAHAERLPSGAINAGDQAVRVAALERFADSELLQLLRPSTVEHAATRHLNRFAGSYVIAVLGLAAIGFALHVLLSGDVVRGLAVATAICVVTCPCALGIAVPLAYELAHVALRKRGVFVRDASFLDRARSIRQIAFDKTGTLTTGRLQVVSPGALRELPGEARAALYQLTARSIHPKSLAIRAALEGSGLPYRPEVRVIERAGLGLEATIDGRTYRLGRASFAAPDAPATSETCYAVDGALLAAIETAETFRADAAQEIDRLRASGKHIVILSGDAEERVQRAASLLGILPRDALFGCSPADKAAWIAAHDPEHTLMVGDGINDSLAMSTALCAATPAIDRPFLPARTDFYFTTPGLSAIDTALEAARELSRTVRSNLVFAVAYNVIVVSTALAGAMAPWLAAIVMPLSSVVVVIRTSAVMARRSRAWRS